MNTEHIIRIFQRVLNTPAVDTYSDFFELGGDSLLATRVLSAIARDFGTELSFEDFLDQPTPDGLFDKVLAVAGRAGLTCA
ncbi:phosphopantetheine-containing protein [Mycobacterium sp. CBMA 234]|uniref:acyl carrier protein n=1 Tax=Mycolicibacterium sp. CBMA 234 TaxID=1918495 RepID=UPI001391CDD3|nr:acyl carrier protein [Mycolicibacterium sp. CBMA 234]MUL64944.1 phosphopantetheine-containing protein [Mycolicibacterium sp. CBMA 234]